MARAVPFAGNERFLAGLEVTGQRNTGGFQERNERQIVLSGAPEDSSGDILALALGDTAYTTKFVVICYSNSRKLMYT